MHEEAAKGERVVPQDDASGIADYFYDAAGDGGAHEEPGSMADAEDELEDDGEGEEGEDDGVAVEGWAVAIDAVDGVAGG